MIAAKPMSTTALPTRQPASARRKRILIRASRRTKWGLFVKWISVALSLLLLALSGYLALHK